MIVIRTSRIKVFIAVWARIRIQIFSDTQHIPTTTTQNSLLIQLFIRPAFWFMVFTNIVTQIAWIKSFTTLEFYSNYVQFTMIMLTASFLIYKQSFQFYHLILPRKNPTLRVGFLFILYSSFIYDHIEIQHTIPIVVNIFSRPNSNFTISHTDKIQF